MSYNTWSSKEPLDLVLIVLYNGYNSPKYQATGLSWLHLGLEALELPLYCFGLVSYSTLFVFWSYLFQLCSELPASDCTTLFRNCYNGSGLQVGGKMAEQCCSGSGCGCNVTSLHSDKGCPNCSGRLRVTGNLQQTKLNLTCPDCGCQSPQLTVDELRELTD